MDDATAKQLLDLNRQFYQTFAVAFSDTRGRLQAGVRRLIGEVTARQTVLDLGCGNGLLGWELYRQGLISRYVGLDNSAGLLVAAAPATQHTPPQATRSAPAEAGLQPNPGIPAPPLTFLQADLTLPTWPAALDGQTFSIVACLAVLHHIPGAAQQLALLRKAAACLSGGGRLWLSNWQFLNSPRLRGRIIPWSAAGLTEAQVDPGDYLLDWRSGGQGLRYAHHFAPDELEALGRQAGLEVVELFLSDGETHNLGLYIVFKKAQG